MLRGWIDARDTTARVPMKTSGPIGSFDLVFEIDTGFFGSMLLPVEWTDLMTSMYEPGSQTIFLADGTSREVRRCSLQVEWFAAVRSIDVLAATPPGSAHASVQTISPFAGPSTRRGGKPNGLIGRQLLSASKLEINWLDGTVSIST